MAVVWEVVIMTKHIIAPEVIKRINEEYKNQAEINTISSIDDWCWSNQRKLDCISSIEQELSEGKIITVEMHWGCILKEIMTFTHIHSGSILKVSAK